MYNKSTKLAILGFVFFLLLMPNAATQGATGLAGSANPGTCLSSTQILEISRLAEATNTTTSTLLGIFDMFCGMHAALDEKATATEEAVNLMSSNLTSGMSSLEADTTASISSINTTVNARINSSIAGLEARIDSKLDSQVDIAEAMLAVANVVNASLNIDRINEIIDRKNTEYIDKIDERLTDYKEEAAGHATAADLESLSRNMTQRIAASRTSQAYQQPIATEIWLAVIAVLVIMGYAVYKKYRKNTRIEKLIRKAPPRLSRRLAKQELDEAEEDADVVQKRKILHRQDVQEQAELLAKELEEEKTKKAKKTKKTKPRNDEDLNEALEGL